MLQKMQLSRDRERISCIFWSIGANQVKCHGIYVMRAKKS